MNTFKPLIIGDLTAKYPIIQGGMGVGISLSSLDDRVFCCQITYDQWLKVFIPILPFLKFLLHTAEPLVSLLLQLLSAHLPVYVQEISQLLADRPCDLRHRFYRSRLVLRDDLLDHA